MLVKPERVLPRGYMHCIRHSEHRFKAYEVGQCLVDPGNKGLMPYQSPFRLIHGIKLLIRSAYTGGI